MPCFRRANQKAPQRRKGRKGGRLDHDGAKVGRLDHDGAKVGRLDHDGAKVGRLDHDGAKGHEGTKREGREGRTPEILQRIR